MSKLNLNLELGKRGYNITILGLTRSGKTVFVQKVLLPIWTKFKLPVAIWDYDDHTDWQGFGVRTNNLRKMKKLLQERKMVRYVPELSLAADLQLGSDLVKALQEEYNRFAKVIFELPDEYKTKTFPCVVVTEEASDVAPSYNLPLGMQNLLRKGNKRLISTISIAQRGAQLNTTVVGQSPLIIMFKQKAGDIEYLQTKKILGRDDAEKLSRLQKYHHLIQWDFWDDGIVQEFPPIKI